jgi:hypothetical protein
MIVFQWRAYVQALNCSGKNRIFSTATLGKIQIAIAKLDQTAANKS